MKRTLSLLLACALGCTLLSGCVAASAARELTAPKQSVNPANSREVNAAWASFGLKLLQKAREAKPGAVLVSPLSAALALSMAANGAEENTLTQFQEVLGNGVDLEELNGACAQLIRDYQELPGSTQCSIANSLWVDPEGQIKDDFVGKCRGVFDAQVFSAKLSDPGIVKSLNSWVSEHTNKLIPKMIDQPFPEETACLLVNALYLKNRWLQEFDPRDTMDWPFHHGDGSITKMEFLRHSDTNLSYIQGEGAQGVVLPYDDGRLAFMAILPDLYPDSPDFEQWLNNLEENSLTQLTNSRQDTFFDALVMPKFEAEWRGNLEDILTLLGLEDPFIPGTANFSAMGGSPEGYYISQVVHAAKIEVNEKGTEAAAATIVAASGSGMPVEQGVTLILDRPFLYGIVDLQTGVPLFLGTYE